MRYVIPFENINTSATANTFLTVVAAIMANTVGHRIRLRALHIGCSDATPADATMNIRVQRVLTGSSKGTGTAIAAANIPKKDNLSLDAPFSGGHTYTVEPTYDAKALFEEAINTRTGLIKEWDELSAPVANQDQLLGIQVAPRTAVARPVSGSMEVELF